MLFRLTAAALLLSAGFFSSVSGFFGFGGHPDGGFWDRFKQTTPLSEDITVFGEDSLTLADDVSILGGSAATNDRASLGRDVYIEGSLVADGADLAAGVTIAQNLEADDIDYRNRKHKDRHWWQWGRHEEQEDPDVTILWVRRSHPGKQTTTRRLMPKHPRKATSASA